MQGKRMLQLAPCPGALGLDGSMGFLMRYWKYCKLTLPFFEIGIGVVMYL